MAGKLKPLDVEREEKLALAKARDGTEGPIAPFTLKPHQLGIDADGDPFGTLIVVPGEPGETTVLRKRQTLEPRSTRTFREAMMKALESAGRDIRVRDDGPVVRAIEVKNVRTEFYRRYPTGEVEAGKPTEARQKAFQRILRNLPDDILIATRNGVELLWRAVP
jgi:hypothetical protein